MLKALPQAHLLEHEQILNFLEARHLYGRGLGWADGSDPRLQAAQRMQPLDLRQTASESSDGIGHFIISGQFLALAPVQAVQPLCSVDNVYEKGVQML